MKTCPFCAENVQDAAIVCKHCGRDIPPRQTPVPAVAPSKAPGIIAARFVLICVLLGLGVVAIILTVINFAGGPASSAPQSSQPVPRLTASASRRNPTAEQLASYVVKTGQGQCPRATRTFFQGINDQQEVWNIECSTGTSYAVTLENSGDVKVVGCDMLRVVKLECFKTFDEQRRPAR